jgi:hypothetical protein
MFLRPRGFAVEMISTPVAKFKCAVAARQRGARYFGSGRDSNLSELRSQADSLGLRDATIEDVRTALEPSTASAKPLGSNISFEPKSLLGYAHKVGNYAFQRRRRNQDQARFRPPWRYACQADYQPRGGRTANQATPSKRDPRAG